MHPIPLLAALCLAACCHSPDGNAQTRPTDERDQKPATLPSASRPVSAAAKARADLLSANGLAGAREVPFETLKVNDEPLHGDYSGLEEELAKVVTDQAAFDELLTKAFSRQEPAPKPPAMDFAKRSVIAVALGTRNSGGYQVSVDSVLEKDGVVWVIVREREPGPGEMVTMALTQPHHVVVTKPVAPRSVRFLRYKVAGG